MSGKIKSVKLKEEFEGRPEMIVTLPFEDDRRSVNLKGKDKPVERPAKAGMPARTVTIKGATDAELKRLAELPEWQYLFDITYEPEAGTGTGTKPVIANS